tara:strand:- start:142 stop:771 length:630 start_codon:yes stop_codon:yes gene_type:complete
MKYYKNSRNRYVYIKQYKVGSSSIDEYTKDHRLCGFDATPEQLQTDYKDWFKFSVVRNPYDRVVSVYVDKCVQNPVDRINRGETKLQTCQQIILKALKKPKRLDQFADITFEDFIRVLPEIYFKDWHFIPQSPFLVNTKGQLVADKIARFENYDEEVKDILTKLGFHIEEMPHKNKTIRKNYKEYYTEETRSIVARLYKDDLAYFNYSF